MTLWILFYAIMVIAVIIAAVLLYHRYRQSVNAKKYAITTKNGINSLESIMLNGVRQWILLRGNDLEKPVLLFISGGPGKPEMSWCLPYQQELEKQFVVVRWDQRGAGKSYSSSIPKETMTIQQLVQDAHQLTQHLKTRFNKQKIFLSGHSFGTALGMFIIQRYPEDYAAFIGAGFLVDPVEQRKHTYEYTLQKAKEANNRKDIVVLGNLGAPPWDDMYKTLVVLDPLLLKYGGEIYRETNYNEMLKHAYFSPYYSLWESMYTFLKGAHFSALAMMKELHALDLRKQVQKVDVPVYIFQGKHDYNTATPVVEEYYAMLKAPEKKLVFFEQSAHNVPYEEVDKFQKEMIRVFLKNTG